MDALIFKHREFKLAKHDLRRIDTLLDAFTKEGRLLHGRWTKNNWLGTVILEKMARTWLQTALREGTVSWDTHLHKLLSIVLMCSLSCRSGDIGLTAGYKNEFLKWSHVEIKLCGEKKLENLEALIVLKYEKDKK